MILAVSVSTGAVSAEYNYDSFGQRTLVQGTEEVRYGFTAREHDALTGLVYYRARSYDPRSGQFLTRGVRPCAEGRSNGWVGRPAGCRPRMSVLPQATFTPGSNAGM